MRRLANLVLQPWVVNMCVFRAFLCHKVCQWSVHSGMHCLLSRPLPQLSTLHGALNGKAL